MRRTTADSLALATAADFARDGGRLQGPAPRDLEGVALALDEQGRLVLDLSSKVDPAWRLPADVVAGRQSSGNNGREG